VGEQPNDNVKEVPGRKRYSKPVLVQYGSIEKLTRGSGTVVPEGKKTKAHA
jgi:hypothetical protein